MISELCRQGHRDGGHKNAGRGQNKRETLRCLNHFFAQFDNPVVQCKDAGTAASTESRYVPFLLIISAGIMSF